ncbi:histone acetyltransferase KAT6B-like [Centropristis striata]|uniref:histone acetyltransferase KAT6B-like n=1 Tax=Centropristis striata TaxID=184440 RepID=UPI0027E14EA7|nr:histone acetyltransferase KAT6B-like [Centropristis striata]
MSVPFSNTNLRVPRGFGTVLEGLAREVLRDQPEDIPKYAALYFEALLKQREETGMDPAEWAAKLEDRFYNNHAFKATEPSPEREPATEMTISKEQSHVSQTEDESSHSAEASNVSTTQPNVSEEINLTESTEEEEEDEEEEDEKEEEEEEEEEEKHDFTERHIISMEKRLSEDESVDVPQAADVQADELSGTEEERDPKITTFDQADRTANGKDSSSAPDQDIPQSELEPTDFLSFRGISNVDVCAEELGTAEDEEGDKPETAAVDEEIKDSEGEENTDVEEPLGIFPYSGLADVDVCAAELEGTERTVDGATDKDDDDSLKPQDEETFVQSSLSRSETPENNQQEAEDQVEKTKEEEGTKTEASSGEIHESLALIEGVLDSNAIPEEDSLVEISFDDVPEAQEINEFEEKQPEDEGSVEVLQTKMLEMQQEEVSKDVTDQNISSAEDHDEPEMMGVEKEINSEGHDMESQHEISDIIKEKVVINDSNLNDSDDDETPEGVKTISSSHQPTTEADEENQEDETGSKNEDNEEMSERDFHQSEDSEKATKSDFKEDEATYTVGGDKEDVHTEGYSEMEEQDIDGGGAEKHPSHVSQSNSSTAATEAQSETFEAQRLPEENEESRRTPVESQPEDTVEGKEVTSKERGSEEEELIEEGKIDSETQEQSDAMCEEGSNSPTHRADPPAADLQGQERPLGSEKDSTEPEGTNGDEVKFKVSSQYTIYASMMEHILPFLDTLTL